jgi:hypothetical protein
VQRFANATPLPDSERQTFKSALDWSHIIYRSNVVPRTGLWMVRLGGWNVEYRATFATSRTDAALETMRMMTDAVQKTVGQSHRGVPACEWAPARRAQNHEQKHVPGALPQRHIGGKNREREYCQDSELVCYPADHGWGAQFLFWRNAAEQNAERLTPLNENDPVTVFGIIDSVWPQMIKSGDKPNLAYDIVIDAPDALELVGVYEGHPPIGELVRFAQRRTVGIYGKIDKKDGKTDIYKAPF